MIKLTKILILLLILFSSAISAVLFEVKDNAGKIIMEVSDDGVRFFNPQYTPVQNEKDTLMVISATSIKALVRKAGGGSASRDFDIADIGSIRKGAGKSVMKMSVQDGYGVGGDSAVVFYKPKNAFRTNTIIQDETLVGDGSFAAGYLCEASGEYSTAIGYRTIADTSASTAMGSYSKASGANSTAMGSFSKASGVNSTAIGSHTLASGLASTAMGGSTNAQGLYALASGNFTNAIGESSTAMGYMTNATGIKSTALGNTTRASGENCVAMGFNSKATQTNATALGSSTVASGIAATSIGSHTTASGENSLSAGYLTESSGKNSLSAGGATKSSGDNSVAFGYNTTVTADLAMGAGESIYNQSYLSHAIGRFNKVGGNLTTWVETDPLFTVGNGPSALSRSNAFEVKKNGNTYIPSLYTTIGSGKYVLVDSNGKLGVTDVMPKEQNQELENLKSENSDLKARVAKLEALMEQMLNK